MRHVACGLALALLACGSSSAGTVPPGSDAGGDAAGDSGVTPDAGGHDAAPSADASQGDAPVPSPDGGAGVAFCDATYGVEKAAFEGCCASGDRTTDDYIFIDAVFGVVLQTCESELASAIARGRVRFDPNAAQACEASFQQTVAQGECWPQIDTNAPGKPTFGASACSGVVTGLQAAGAPCAVDFECADGLTCVGWAQGADGTCTMPGAAGAACERAADAGAGLYVDWGLGMHPSCAAGAYCSGSACVAQGGSGASCGSDDACTSGLTCHEAACGTTGPAAAGGGCKSKSDCQEGLYCDPSGNTCQPREPAGGGCTSGSDVCKGYCAVPDGGSGGVCTAVCGSG
jgi:hypothetical protein